jgi:hypothetical protein
MADNPSLELSLLFKEQMQLNLLPAFKEDFPEKAVTSYIAKKYGKTDIRKRPRDKVYIICNILLVWLLSATQERRHYLP